MSTSSWYDWQNLPEIIFSDIVMMVEKEIKSLNNLQKFRQVCQSWNVMLSQMTKNKKDNIRRIAESLAYRIRVEWNWTHKPLLSEIATAASLAHHGLLGSVVEMNLEDVDLASVPPEHQASLAYCVSGHVNLYNVSNCDIVSILEIVNCETLVISGQVLSSEETQALVWAMESNVKRLVLGPMGEVSLDIRALTQYSGQGKCEGVGCYRGTAVRYKKDLRSWAEKINWTVNLDIYESILFSSNKNQ